MLSWPVVFCQYNKKAQVQKLQVLSGSTSESVSLQALQMYIKQRDIKNL